MINIACQTLSG